MIRILGCDVDIPVLRLCNAEPASFDGVENTKISRFFELAKKVNAFEYDVRILGVLETPPELTIRVRFKALYKTNEPALDYTLEGGG